MRIQDNDKFSLRYVGVTVESAGGDSQKVFELESRAK